MTQVLIGGRLPGIDTDPSGDRLPVVLMHGNGGGWRGWEPLLPLLTPRHRVIAFDQRGFGDAPGTDGELDYLAMADDTAAALRGHGVTRCVLAGLSMGSGVIQTLAVRHPDLVASGVLGALGRIDRTALAETELPPAVRAALVERRQPTDDEVRETAAFVFSARTRRERPELVEASYQRLRQHDWASAAARGFTTDGLSSIDPALISAPMVVLGGAEDRAVPPQHVRELAAALPDADLVVLEDVGHAVLAEAPDALAAAVESAVARARPLVP